MPPESTTVIALVGPTCTGKTDLSLALAEKLNGDIILCDSRTIYRKMDIGTAKPTREQQSRAPHFMIDLLEPSRFYSVAEYKASAEIILQELGTKARLPIVCGGTGLYARALLEGMVMPSVPPQIELRKELNDFADLNGNEALHLKLQEVDAQTAKRLNVNDRIRIIRAIEVSLTAGIPFSRLAGKSESIHRTLWIGLTWSDRSKHKAAIAGRFDQQMQQGLLEEVQTLFQNPEYEKILLRAVNYKEFVPYLSGKSDLQNASQDCITSNCQLSRKQMIWFRANPKINWFAVDEKSVDDICDQVLNLYRQGFSRTAQ
jgi:tRNA dimethylallyltransferase